MRYDVDMLSGFFTNADMKIYLDGKAFTGTVTACDEEAGWLEYYSKDADVDGNFGKESLYGDVKVYMTKQVWDEYNEIVK